MKRLIALFAIAAVSMFFNGCSKSDDSNPVNNTSDVITGSWVSESVDIAPGLIATLKTVKIVATFNTNNTYKVIATDSAGASVTYEGTYSTSANTGSTIRGIVLNQTVPTSVTSTGIYQIDAAGNMKYEVIQTTPAIQGFTAPTAAEGFGSTKYNNIPLGATWTQRFVPAAPAKDPIKGNWLSEGVNVAPGLKATLKTKKIVATFNDNNTYTVVATDSNDVNVTYSGTFTSSAAENTSIRNITLNQTVPTSVTSTGIYRVTAYGYMQYEVIQTTPAIQGFAAPTVAGGFGSTSYNTIKLGATWIQGFVKQ
ncbi:MAG: hypothetical protein L6Q59_07945 [Ignavibacteriaceae bacterium]|nr:hypothetical protein [Ignavibacteriaceae bacterium]